MIQKGYLLIFDNELLFEEFNYCTCLEINCNWIGSTSSNTEDLQTNNYRKASECIARNAIK